jgi:hypothetical protein
MLRPVSPLRNPGTECRQLDYRETPAKRQVGRTDILYGYRQISARWGQRPEHQALLKLIGTLLDD